MEYRLHPLASGGGWGDLRPMIWPFARTPGAVISQRTASRPQCSATVFGLGTDFSHPNSAPGTRKRTSTAIQRMHHGLFGGSVPNAIGRLYPAGGRPRVCLETRPLTFGIRWEGEATAEPQAERAGPDLSAGSRGSATAGERVATDVAEPSRLGGSLAGCIRSLVGGGWGDLAPMMSQPLGSLGLWTVNEPRDGPSAPS